ncbi:MAG: hypothetical protein WCH44_09815 [Betaproteobacteria bacterium]
MRPDARQGRCDRRAGSISLLSNIDSLSASPETGGKPGCTWSASVCSRRWRCSGSLALTLSA